MALGLGLMVGVGLALLMEHWATWFPALIHKVRGIKFSEGRHLGHAANLGAYHKLPASRA